MICPIKIHFTRCHTDEIPDTTEYYYQDCIKEQCAMWNHQLGICGLRDISGYLQGLELERQEMRG